jgi:hypothetical protein
VLPNCHRDARSLKRCLASKGVLCLTVAVSSQANAQNTHRNLALFTVFQHLIDVLKLLTDTRVLSTSLPWTAHEIELATCITSHRHCRRGLTAVSLPQTPIALSNDKLVTHFGIFRTLDPVSWVIQIMSCHSISFRATYWTYPCLV